MLIFWQGNSFCRGNCHLKEYFTRKICPLLPYVILRESFAFFTLLEKFKISSNIIFYTRKTKLKILSDKYDIVFFLNNQLFECLRLFRWKMNHLWSLSFKNIRDMTLVGVSMDHLYITQRESVTNRNKNWKGSECSGLAREKIIVSIISQ